MNAVFDQAEFARALRAADLPPPAGIVAWNGSNVAQRFSVYRNNVVTSLINAIGAKFPVVEQLVGSEFFKAMARVYVADHPPTSPRMALYGDDFPAFVEQFEPARCLPYLAGVAALEAARVRAFHAADAQALGPSEFGSLDPERLCDLTITLHPSLTIVRSKFAIVSLWAAHNGALDIAAVDPFMPEDALVARPRLDVEVTRLDPGIATFIERLGAGFALGDAALDAIATAPGLQLSTALQVLVNTGVASGISRYLENFA